MIFVNKDKKPRKYPEIEKHLRVAHIVVNHKQHTFVYQMFSFSLYVYHILKIN